MSIKRKKSIILVLLLMGLVGCQQAEYADLTAEQNAPLLNSEIDQNELVEYRSSSHGVVFSHPVGWVVEEGETVIYFVPSEDHFPWDYESFSSPKTYYIIETRSPYLSRNDRRLRRARSATELAQATVDVFSIESLGELTEPVSAVNINGRDGASFLIDVGDDYFYEVLQRLSADVVVSVRARGPKEEIEDMKAVVNAVALNIRLLSDN